MSLTIDIAFVAVAALIVFISAKRGFLVNLVNTVRVVLAALSAYMFGPELAKFVNSSIIGKPIWNSVNGKVVSVLGNTVEKVDADEFLSSVPKFLVNDDLKAKIDALSAGENYASDLTDLIANPLSSAISTVIGYVLVFILSLLIIFFATKVLNRMIDKTKGVKKVNCILGGLLGLVVAFIVLTIAASILRLFAGSSEFYTNSVILKFFGDFTLLKSLRILNAAESFLF